jgi:hypothetical protein
MANIDLFIIDFLCKRHLRYSNACANIKKPSITMT